MTDEQTNETDTQGKEDNSTDTLFEKTDKAAERLEEANKKTEELLNRQEEIYAKQKLGGQSSGGQEAPEKKEETPKEYNARIDKEISEGQHND